MFTARIIFRWLFYWWRNLYGDIVGYGHCVHCRCTWNWVEDFGIPYNYHRAMFPLCDLCFRKLSTQKVISYAKNRVSVWSPDIHPEKEKIEIHRNVVQAIKFIKKEISERPFEALFWPDRDPFTTISVPESH